MGKAKEAAKRRSAAVPYSGTGDAAMDRTLQGEGNRIRNIKTATAGFVTPAIPKPKVPMIGRAKQAVKDTVANLRGKPEETTAWKNRQAKIEGQRAKVQTARVLKRQRG